MTKCDPVAGDVLMIETSKTEPHLSPSQVESEAIKVLKEHNLTTIPIDPLVLARRKNIQVNNARFSDPDVVGMIIRRGEDVSILVSRDHPPLRKRFTIAHDLGHRLLHLSDDGEFVDREADLFRQRRCEEHTMTDERRKEVEANIFAASLLMPADEVRRYWMERKSIKELARIFKVSEEAMGYRVDSLGLD